MRIARVFRLVRASEKLQRIINIFLLSLPSLFNVGALMFLVKFLKFFLYFYINSLSISMRY